jgi:chromosome segregation ATPase
MDNALERIQLLVNRYKEKKEQLVAELEDLKLELQEIDGKLSAFNTTLNSLQDEGVPREEAAATLTDISDKYTNVKKNEAILDVLNSDPEKVWKAKEVVDSLIKNGLKTESKNLLRDVYNELSRLAKAKNPKVVTIKTRGKRRGRKGRTGYQIKKEDVNEGVSLFPGDIRYVKVKKNINPVETSSTPS